MRARSSSKKGAKPPGDTPATKLPQADAAPANLSFFRTLALGSLLGCLVTMPIISSIAGGRHRPQDVLSLMGQEPALVSVFEKTASRLGKEILPKAKTKGCREDIKNLQEDILSFRRYFPRHPDAEMHCPIDLYADMPGASQSGHHPPVPPLVDAEGRVKMNSTIVFAIQFSPSDNHDQVTRLLDTLLPQGSGHIFHMQIDARPEGPARRMEALVRGLAAKHGHNKTIVIGPSKGGAVDVVYGGMSLQDAFIKSWRDAVASGWDFDHLLNISPADYPIKSIGFMSAALAAMGRASHTESFFQKADFVRGRGMRDWFATCRDEPCGGVWAAGEREKPSEEQCTGYIYWLREGRKPPMAGCHEFGGSAFQNLHADFVRYTVRCLDDDEFAASDVYCPSVRGIYAYFNSSMSAEELFPQTVLFNGPHCREVAGGNLRWVNWQGHGRKVVSRATTEYPVTSPGHITKELATSQFDVRRNNAYPFFARKFDFELDPLAFDVADAAAGIADALMTQDKWDGLYPGRKGSINPMRMNGKFFSIQLKNSLFLSAKSAAMQYMVLGDSSTVNNRNGRPWESFQFSVWVEGGREYIEIMTTHDKKRLCVLPDLALHQCSERNPMSLFELSEASAGTLLQNIAKKEILGATSTHSALVRVKDGKYLCIGGSSGVRAACSADDPNSLMIISSVAKNLLSRA